MAKLKTLAFTAALTAPFLLVAAEAFARSSWG